MSTLTLTLPKLHSRQQLVKDEAVRFNIVDCGRRWGKNVLGYDRLIEPALYGYPVAWFSPTYKMLKDAWREVRKTTLPVVSSKNEQENRLDLITGGSIDMWSLDNPDVARGRGYKRIVVDEAAIIRKLREAWQEVLRPTLTDFQGDAWFHSTPKGHNFFYELYIRGMDESYPDWKAWKFPTNTNPHLPPGEVEDARRTLPERIFQQEYLAEFMEHEGAVFRNVRESAVLEVADPKDHDGHKKYIGVDWGKHLDFTAISIGCQTCAKELDFDRFNQIDYVFQRKRLALLQEKWKSTRIVAESNAMGEPIIESLQREGLPVVGFTMTSVSKPPLIEDLALVIERSDWKFIDDPIWTLELEAYERTVNSNTQRSSYSAPEGMHDDTVIARALMYSAVAIGEPIAAWA